MTVTPLARQASIREETHFVTPHMAEWECRSNSQASSKEAYCLRLSYSGDLKTRNNHVSGSLGTCCHSACMEDSYRRQSWRGKGSDVDLPRSLSSGELQQWVAQWLVSLSFVTRRKPLHLRFTAESELGAWLVNCSASRNSLPAAWAYCQSGPRILNKVSQITQLLQPSPSHKVINCWVGCEHTKTSRQNVWFLYFSIFSSELCSVASPTVELTWGTFLGLDPCFPWRHKWKDGCGASGILPRPQAPKPCVATPSPNIKRKGVCKMNAVVAVFSSLNGARGWALKKQLLRI
jgi:hypothetical protein